MGAYQMPISRQANICKSLNLLLVFYRCKGSVTDNGKI